jgi:hypothetical protein
MLLYYQNLNLLKTYPDRKLKAKQCRFSIQLVYQIQPSTKDVFSADHYRAIADMVLDGITKGYDIESSIILDDWLPEQHEKEKLYCLIDSFKPALTEKQWQKITSWKMKR